jgi:hypothetical protein
MASLHPDIGLFQHRFPLLRFRAHVGVEIPGRAADRRGAHLFQRGQDHWIFQRGGKVGVDFWDQVRRHGGGAEKAPPDRGVPLTTQMFVDWT